MDIHLIASFSDEMQKIAAYKTAMEKEQKERIKRYLIAAGLGAGGFGLGYGAGSAIGRLAGWKRETSLPIRLGILGMGGAAASYLGSQAAKERQEYIERGNNPT